MITSPNGTLATGSTLRGSFSSISVLQVNITVDRCCPVCNKRFVDKADAAELMDRCLIPFKSHLTPTLRKFGNVEKIQSFPIPPKWCQK